MSASPKRGVPLVATILALLAQPAARAGETTAATAVIAQAGTDSAASPWRAPAPLVARRSGTVRIGAATASFAGAVGQVGGRPAYAGNTVGSLRFGLPSNLVAEVRARMLTLDRGAEFERRSTRTEARLRLGDERRSAWIGAAFEHSLSGTRLPRAPLLALGAEGLARDIALSASLEQTVERVRIATQVQLAPPVDTIAAQMITAFDSRLVTATTARVAGRWEHHRIAVESVAGLTLNRLTSPSPWTQSSVTLALKPRLAVYATVGNPAPRWLALEAGFERRASLGLRLTSSSNAAMLAPPTSGPSQPAWRLRHLGQGWQVIEIHAPGALRVDVMGDFTGWNSATLVHVTDERWALAFKMGAGVHQVQVRLDDGPWSPPAGLPTTSDGFSGMVGVFVAR